jgi:hypothetical protein
MFFGISKLPLRPHFNVWRSEAVFGRKIQRAAKALPWLVD